MGERKRCVIDGCERLEELANGRPTGGRCAAHRKRKHTATRLTLTSPVVSRFWKRRDGLEALLESALAYADVDADEAYTAAVLRLKRAALRYAESLGYSQHGDMHRHAPTGKVPSKG